MKRSLFIAAAVSGVAISGPLLARAENGTNPARIETNGEATGWGNAMWNCGSAIVWLNVASGIYYYKGDRRYGRTKQGAYTCEREAISAENRASLDGQK
ncbi:MAG: hypothetical protein WCB99_04045 [Candidatus Cybelea sp.]